MPSIVARIAKEELVVGMPKWLPANMHYEVMMGSVAYGVSSDASDVDVYGFCIPPKELVFPHLAGEIDGFGTQVPRFYQYDPHHIKDPAKGKEYDLAIYSIVKYFDLVMGCNPNMIDSLFVPRRCVLFSSPIGEMVRDRRKLFLHKGAWHKFKGYAYSQLHKIGQANKSNPKRAADVEAHGYDTKFAYHVVRLLNEVEQIMVEHDLDITRDREQLKAIRRGEWKLEYLHEWFEAKEKALEGVYAASTLRYGPDEEALRELLLDCLEHHYGSLESAVKRDVQVDRLVAELKVLVQRYGG
jgi:uncharacterized protein